MRKYYDDFNEEYERGYRAGRREALRLDESKSSDEDIIVALKGFRYFYQQFVAFLPELKQRFGFIKNSIPSEIKSMKNSLDDYTGKADSIFEDSINNLSEQNKNSLNSELSYAQNEITDFLYDLYRFNSKPAKNLVKWLGSSYDIKK